VSSHYPLAPSSAARTVACPGSVSLGARYPEEDTAASLEGTAAHWVAQEVLTGKQILVGTMAPNGIPVDEDMLDGAAFYQAVHFSIGALNPVIEKTLVMAGLHPDNGGTPDSWDAPTPHDVHLIDYKYGHERVEIFENWQLINYMFGILEHLGVNGATDQHTWCNFHIVQPRCYDRAGPHTTWRVRASDLRPYFNNLRHAFEVAMSPNPPTFVTAECKYCPARHACSTLQRAALAAVDYSGTAVPFDLSAQAVGTELRALQRAAAALNARKDALETQALEMIRRGELVPHFAVEKSNGREVWNFPVDDVIALGEAYGINLAKPKDVITPNQARQKGIDAAVISAYATRRSGALELVANQKLTARKVFAK
jgi:hypothetical protein